MKFLLKVFVVLLMGVGLTACSGITPSTIGQFAECPSKPNCVSTKSVISYNKISPLGYNGSTDNARDSLLRLIKSMPRTNIMSEKESLIHVEFTSKIFRFVDDVEFYFEDPGIIHFRSASRLGHSDLGVNRERMENIRQLFEYN
jgi:uncharacterized protein (DUF1499 family)